ncbi:MAG: LPS assembly lipoprotein LptE [Gammaproteobacteria bacterium]|nr:LPS assembly lipoprotein LptE [Gammaproteobacteria bacterium]
MCILLTACGFQLRGTAESEFRIPALYLTAEHTYGELIRALERRLSSNGTELVSSRDLAPWTVSLLAERFSRRVASTTRDISVAKYELILQVHFSLAAQDGKLLIPPASLIIERLYDYDPSNLVGSDAEEELLRQEMRTDIIDRIVRRIGTTINSQAAT